MKSRYIRAVVATVVCIVAAVLIFDRSFSRLRPSAAARAPAISEKSAADSVSPSSSLQSSSVASAPFPWLSRAPAAIAHRHEERAGFAWILRQFGASEATLDRLAQGDLNELMADLKRQALRGNATATNTLGWLARRCSLLRSPEVLQSYDAAQKAQAQMLSQSDANWLTSLIDEDETREGAMSSACASEINQGQIEALVGARAEQGDAGSKWLESESASNAIELRTLLRRSAASGFPEAQYELARQLLGSQDPQWHLAADPSQMDLLRKAAIQLPDARANLAVCEFKGCNGTTPDLTAAVHDARTAAQSGQPAAMLSLSATLPVGALEPDEGEAWQLFEAVLELQGCRVNKHYVDWLKGINAALASPAITPQVQALANQYWQAYGAAAESQLGCGPRN
jgi:hypothetical protein